jgi:predicted NBD/HSP70 family sugar kinase
MARTGEGRNVNKGKSGSLSSLRELNRLRVLEVVRERSSVSRADIARETGLARSTVSTLVGELMGTGLLVEREEVRSASPSQTGRPPVLLSLDPGAGSVVGIHFDHGYVRVAIADLSLAIMAEAERELDIDHDGAAGLGAAADLVEDVLARTGVDRERVLGAGVGLAGPIHSRAIGSTVLPGWVGIDVQVELEQRLGLPVHVENDANLGGLAESVLGAGRGASEMVYLMLSSGIGAALILGGRLYRGSGGTAGEIGHVLVDENGPMCRCGNRGCLETLAGSGALVDLLRRSHGDDLTVERMIAQAESGDPGCQRVLADAGRTVGAAVAALCNQLNPARVVVGGQLASVGELLIEPLRQAVQRHALPAAVEHLQVVGAELGQRAELLGALVLVLGQSERSVTGLLPAAVGG